jgi:hypothetical protein
MKNIKCKIVMFFMVLFFNFIPSYPSFAEESRQFGWYDEMIFIKENDTLFLETKNVGIIGIELQIPLLNLDSNDTHQIIEIYKRKYLSAYILNLSFVNLTQSDVNYILNSIKKFQIFSFNEYFIKKLSIKNCILDSLPDSPHFHNIEGIEFIKTEIRSLKGFSSKDIVDLNVINSFLNGFPENIDNQNNIFKLTMSFKSDKNLSLKIDYYDELYRFFIKKNLRIVEIDGIDFEKYPEFLFEFDIIKIISVECSSLIELPISLNKRQNELWLDISKTQITYLPEWINKLRFKLYLFTNTNQRDLNINKFRNNLKMNSGAIIFEFNPNENK